MGSKYKRNCKKICNQVTSIVHNGEKRCQRSCTQWKRYTVTEHVCCTLIRSRSWSLNLDWGLQLQKHLTLVWGNTRVCMKIWWKSNILALALRNTYPQRVQMYDTVLFCFSFGLLGSITSFYRWDHHRKYSTLHWPLCWYGYVILNYHLSTRAVALSILPWILSRRVKVEP